MGATDDRLLGVIQTQTDIARLGPDLGTVMALVAQRAGELTRASGSVVELAEGEDMVYRAVSGIAAPQLGLRLKRDTSLSGLCVKTGQGLRCDDSETDDRVDREACRRVGLRSMLCVPLKHQDNVVGALKVVSAEVSAFNDDDVRILELMSGLIAASMYHATQSGASELFHKATHDPLTGIPNRALFFDRLRHCLTDAQRKAEPVGVLLMDMDGLKPINDELGHRVGDAAIREMALRLKGVIRESDTIARLGGDEFGAVLYRIGDRTAAVERAERLTQQVSLPFVFEEKPVTLGASIGLAMFPEDAAEPDALVEKADQAMYAVKRTRKNRR